MEGYLKKMNLFSEIIRDNQWNTYRQRMKTAQELQIGDHSGPKLDQYKKGSIDFLQGQIQLLELHMVIQIRSDEEICLWIL